ncbi:MAG: LysR family transcriptional regulator [Pseudomonadota bacterium]
MELNYHHLRYFREVARDGHLTRTAERLNLSQSALSAQIRTLEDRLGHALFDRVGRRLELTEVGRIALDHAELIFSTGEEFMASLGAATGQARPLKVGALSTLSRNFQMQFLRPLLAQEVPVVLRSGGLTALLDELESLSLDVVLTTAAPPQRAGAKLAATRIADQAVGVHGVLARLRHPDLQSLLAAEPLILPTDPVLRTPLEGLFARLDLAPHIAADVDDMAMVRLLAREGIGVALVPGVVVADEVAAGTLATAPFDLDISEPFYAVTLQRRFPHPALASLLG